MSNQEDVRQDLEELHKLRLLATRPNIKDFLTKEALRLQQCIDAVPQPVEAEPSITPTVSSAAASGPTADGLETNTSSSVGHCIAVKKTVPSKYYKDITTYAWDQSDKFMKIYVTLNGVHKLSKESISVEFKSKSFHLKVENLNGANYSCHVVGLWGQIVADQCFHKVKTDMVLLMLKKEEEKKTWAFVTEREDKKRSTPKFDEKKDPNEGLMDLLKQMYEDGDDEMKRTIAKSWCESRNKTSGEAM